MISNLHTKEYCKDDISKIENYDLAIADESQLYVLHHRLETHFADGQLRPIDARLSKAELINLGMYFHRPANELIFMTRSDHTSLHHKGKTLSLETRTKIGASELGNKYWLGRKHSEEAKKKISKAKKGRKLSEDHKRKISQGLTAKS